FAGGIGLFLFFSRRAGALVLLVVALALVATRVAPWSPAFIAASRGTAPGLVDVAVQFAIIGTLTFGGSLSIIKLIHDQVVHHLGWLTPQEFIDGLALGQLTPGPPVMLAAYVGYKLVVMYCADVWEFAIFLPSVELIFSSLSILRC